MAHRPGLWTPGEIIPARTDPMFKRLFADKDHTDLLACMLSKILPEQPTDEWDDLRLLETRTPRWHVRDKITVLDVRALSATGTAIDIEIQLHDHSAVRERMTYYSASLLTAQLSQGQEYHEIRPAITIVITGFVLVPSDTDYRHTFVLHDVDHHHTFTDVLQVRTLELPKVPADDDGTPAWAWMRFLAADTKEEMSMAAANDPHIARAISLAERFSADPATRHALESEQKAQWDQWAREHDAEQRGLTAGRHEAARNALALGLSVEQTAAVAGLDVAEVSRLAEQP